jgi:hypothetical protein
MSKTPFPIFSRSQIDDFDLNLEKGTFRICFDTKGFIGDEYEYTSEFRLTPSILCDIINGESDLWYEISKYAKKQVIK